jgi:hypothetical protein
MGHVVIHHDVITQMVKEMQESFDSNGPIRMSVVAEALDGRGPGVAESTNFYLPRLLLWLDERRREDQTQYAEVEAFAADEGLEPDFVGNLITVLEQRRHIRAARTIDTPVMPESFITELGQAEAQRLRELRSNPVRRTLYARDTLANWLFANFKTSHADVAAFVQAKQSSFFDDQLSGEEILEAVRFLAAQGLATVDADEAGLQLTTVGVECVLSGVSVSDYTSRRVAGGDTYFVGVAHGGVFGGQHQTVTQINRFGFNPDEIGQLANLAVLVQQVGPALGLPETEHHELHQAAEALAVEAADPEREPGRLRRATDRVLAGLMSATQATAALTMLIEAGRKAVTAVFGA